MTDATASFIQERFGNDASNPLPKEFDETNVMELAYRWVAAAR